MDVDFLPLADLRYIVAYANTKNTNHSFNVRFLFRQRLTKKKTNTQILSLLFFLLEEIFFIRFLLHKNRPPLFNHIIFFSVIYILLLMQ